MLEIVCLHKLEVPIPRLFGQQQKKFRRSLRQVRPRGLTLFQQALQLSGKVMEINQETLLRFQHFEIFLGDEQGVEKAGIIIVAQQDVQTLKGEARVLTFKSCGLLSNRCCSTLWQTGLMPACISTLTLRSR